MFPHAPSRKKKNYVGPERSACDFAPPPNVAGWAKLSPFIALLGDRRGAGSRPTLPILSQDVDAPNSALLSNLAKYKQAHRIRILIRDGPRTAISTSSLFAEHSLI